MDWRAEQTAAGDERRGRTALVTGGAGFIGSHIVEALIARQWRVLVVDDLSSGNRANVPAGAELHNVDITSPELGELCRAQRFGVVVHCAAQVKVDLSMADPDRDRAVNVLGTAAVLAACREAGVSRVVFLSTGGAIYGETPVPATEEALPKPVSYYAVHKYAAERYVELSGLSYAILRLANVYGPRQRSDLEGGVVSIFMERLRQGLPVQIFGTGEQVRDFVYVKDVVAAVLTALEDRRAVLWNVGTGVPVSIKELLSLLSSVLGPARDVTFGPAREGDVFRSCLDIGRIRREGPWQPGFMLREGILDMAKAREG